MKTRLGSALLLSSLACAVASPARAEGAATKAASPPATAPARPRVLGRTEREAYAERLFQHGVQRMKQDDCAEAVREFTTSQELDPSAATLVNLATCYARLGRKATAWKTYRKAATAAQLEGDDALRARSFHAMSLLSPTLTKLRIIAPNAASPLSLRINGEPVTGYDGLPIPLDPGESVVEAAAPGHEPWRRSVTAGELGATLVIEVPELRPVEPAQRGPDLRTPALVAGGAGVALLVVGAVLAVNASATYDDSNAHCGGGRCTARGVDLRQQAIQKAQFATYAIGIGTVATGAGIALWLLSPPSPKPAQEAMPWVEGGTPGFGLTLGGTL